jgi:hypothetical protein
MLGLQGKPQFKPQDNADMHIWPNNSYCKARNRIEG